MPDFSREAFVSLADAERERSLASGRPGEILAIPIAARLLSDQLTPVLAYRRLVAPDERTAPSFLLESVEGGERQGRYSILSSEPVAHALGRGPEGEIRALGTGEPWGPAAARGANPLELLKQDMSRYRLVIPPSRSSRPGLPACCLGGWVGYAGYDAVRYAEPEKLGFGRAPPDDTGLADVSFHFYTGVVVFDHVEKLVYVVRTVLVGPGSDAGDVYGRAARALRATCERVQRHSRPLPSGEVSDGRSAVAPPPSNMTRARHAAMVSRALEYIRAGDIFQVVLGQRFERVSKTDPFDAYRALRVVNPSPYMVYMQSGGCVLVASSPEILCRVQRDGTGAFVVTNRPLAGTRRRGRTPEEDAALERELLADPKERAEHIMLVDLGRNDVGRVAVPGSIRLPGLMEVERYSHVMHISSTVTGVLRAGLTCWDALRAALPVGTISGAPKVRAMEIIDELEPVKRGPYGGGMGYAALDGQMDIALTLRTMVAPVSMRRGDAWTYHLQAAGGIVADSDPTAEYQETVNKAAALSRAIDLAESAFPGVGGAG